MSREQLESALERLRRELAGLDRSAGEAHPRLHALIEEVEAELARQDSGAGTTSLGESIRRQIEVFEVEHPRITNVLNEIMVTLSNMGI